MRVIETEADIDEGVAFLQNREPRFALAIEKAGFPPLRRRETGFGSLLRIIIDQQVSVAAGAAIWRRVEAGGATTPAAVLKRDIEALRELGFSRPKARAAIAVAEAIEDGRLCFTRQSQLPYEDAFKEMVALKGIGPWTAQIYHMFCEGRADILAAGDHALQESARILFALDERPKAKELAQMAEPWSPWRGVAARILWSYYRVRMLS